jgi:hypothetical protein
VKHIAVIIRAAEPDRVAEALRAALGLSLRGDAVHVVLTGAALPAAGSRDARIIRALATLTELGHSVTRGDAQVPAAVRRADAVEVWT